MRAAIGDESLAIYDDNNPLRVSNRAELEAKVSAWTRQYTQSELIEVCQKADLAAGPIYSPAEIVKDPHIIARGSLISLDDEETGKPVRMASPAGRFSGFKGEVRTLGPRLGEHTESVLGGLLGFPASRIEALRAKGVIK